MQGDLFAIVDACARHGIRAISPWRDQVAQVGLNRAVRAVRDAGLELSGYCRGGMFTADAVHRIEVRDDNRRAVDEAALKSALDRIYAVEEAMTAEGIELGHITQQRSRERHAGAEQAAGQSQALTAPRPDDMLQGKAGGAQFLCRIGFPHHSEFCQFTF